MKDNIINRKIILVLASFQLSLNLNADFLKIDKDNIEKSKINLKREEFNRKAILLGGSTVITGLIGHYIWNMLNYKQEELNIDFKKFSNLTEDQKNQLKDVFNINKDNNEKEISWKMAGLKFIKSTVPLITFELGKSVLFTKLAEILNRSLPSAFKLSDRLFSHKTINWFLEYKTSFLDTIKSLSNSIDNFVFTQETDKEGLESDYNMLVSQVEKILGFMIYNSDILPQELKAEKRKALFIQKRTVTILIDFLNLIKSSDKLDLDYAQKLKQTLLKLTENIESFNQIDKSLGLYDEVNRPVFDRIKKILSPERYNQKINLNELEDFMGEFLNQNDQDDLLNEMKQQFPSLQNL